MFRIVRWLIVLLVCLGAVGVFRGWFSFSTPSHDADTNTLNINVSVDASKVKADAEKAEQFTENVAQRIKEERDKAKSPDVK
jgi:hypothetical protein